MRLQPRAAFAAVVALGVAVGVLSTATVAGSGESLALGSDVPAWSPDGQSLAYVGFRKGRVGDIYTISAAGGPEERLTATKAHEDTPRWSHDGRKIAFVRLVRSVRQIFVMNADGSGQTQLTTADEPSFAPTWSPDDALIAFARGLEGGASGESLTDQVAPSRNDDAEIHVMRSDGTVETQLTDNHAFDINPAWSPDGQLIAFTSDRAGAQQIYVMRPNGGEQRKLTDDPVAFHTELRPAWSADGATIAFVAERDPPLGNTEIYVVDANGHNVRRLTRNKVYDDWPAWSPDEELAISRGRSILRPEIYVMSAAGTVARRVTGKDLRFAGLWRTPTDPLAGRLFTLELAVRPSVDRFTDISCFANLARRPLAETVATTVAGRVRCSWAVPRSAKGRRLYAGIIARAGGSEVSRTVATVVR